MSLSLVQIYVSANVLLLLASALLSCARAVSSRSRRPIAYRQQLHCAYWLVAASVTVPVIAAFLAPRDFLPATAQIWSAPSVQVLDAQASSPRSASVSLTATGAQMRLDLLTGSVAAICVSGLMVALTRLLIGVTGARKVIAGAHLIRRRGALRILAAADCCVPFSFWSPGRFFIVVPIALLTRPQDLRIALRHEAQHHRQGDTRLLYVGELLTGVFFLNPASHLVGGWMRELQEFACDEAVIERHALAARKYCDCLLWVAQNAVAQRAPGLCMRMADPMLARRIQALLPMPTRHVHALAAVALQMLATILLLATGIALAGTVQDRRVSLSEAQAMAAVARRQTAAAPRSFPIVVDPQVVAEINRLVGTPDGRAFWRATLQRMRSQETLVTQKLEQQDLPAELLAVPLIESGYRNRPEDGNPQHGAGIWMFVQPTGRASGLQIDARRDDRLNPALESEAAARLLSRLRAEFGDWNLALLAYNGGSAAVHRAILAAGTRDAFELARRGYEHDPHYLARVMAAIILMRSSHVGL